MDIELLQGFLTAQSAALATTRRIHSVAADAINLLIQEEDDNHLEPVHGGSRPGRRPNLPRGFMEGYERIYKDYLAPNPIYGETLFRRRFRMHRNLFMKIVDDVTAHNIYFQQKPDALGKLGLHPVQKIASALRMLAYGGAADLNDEYFRLSESTSLEALKEFCNSIISLYDSEFRRQPTVEDIKRLTKINAKRGFPGMLGSLDCMHWCWKNCPAAWKGQFQGKEKVSLLLIVILPTLCIF